MTAQEILKLIETVDRDDSAMLDEIDARVDAYVNNRPFNEYDKETGHYETVDEDDTCEWKPYKYTRSRDALKAIRPEGWEWYMTQGGLRNRYRFGCASDMIGSNQMSSPYLVTEELAELHVIIQTIEFERGLK